MHTRNIFPALLAASASLVSAQKKCTKDIEISDPNPVFDCEVIDAEVTIASKFSGPLSLENVEQIKTLNLTGSDVSEITSSSLAEVGTLELNDLQQLIKLSLTSLKSVDSLKLAKLNRLDTLTFGTKGVTKATTVIVTDTSINDLSGLKLDTVDTMDINNNGALRSFDSDLVNVTSKITIVENFEGMNITMKKLKTAGEIQLRGAAGFDAPALENCENGIKFDSCPQLESFRAPNLTDVGGSITFINNKKVSNISFPVLKTVTGDITIINNTDLVKLNGFPKVEKVTGAIYLGGNFEEVELPSLVSVSGTVNVTSTTDIESFCKTWDELKADKKISGGEDCSSNNKNANEEGGAVSGGGDGGSGSGSGDSNNDDDGNAAGIASVNMALLGLAAFAALAQFL